MEMHSKVHGSDPEWGEAEVESRSFVGMTDEGGSQAPGEDQGETQTMCLSWKITHWSRKVSWMWRDLQLRCMTISQHLHKSRHDQERNDNCGLEVLSWPQTTTCDHAGGRTSSPRTG